MAKFSRCKLNVKFGANCGENFIWFTFKSHRFDNSHLSVLFCFVFVFKNEIDNNTIGRMDQSATRTSNRQTRTTKTHFSLPNRVTLELRDEPLVVRDDNDRTRKVVQRNHQRLNALVL